MTLMPPLAQWRLAAREAGHRCCLWVSGTPAEGRQWASLCVSDTGDSLLWVGHSDDYSHAIHSSRVRHVLGQEFSCVVFDAHAGFSPDAFCMAAGTLVAGGLLVLLAPAAVCWGQGADDDYTRMLPWGCEPPVPAYFLRRVAQALEVSGVFHLVDTSAGRWLAAPVTPSRRWTSDAALAAQQTALEACLASVLAQQPVLVTAGRGRGKSALLGRLAAHLVASGRSVVVVSARAPAMAATRHWYACEAEQVLQGGSVPALPWMAPDEWLAAGAVADLLLVDEAATLPVALLHTLRARQPCCVLASTCDGYEGSGQGLLLRFLPAWRKVAPALQVIDALLPLRWADDDPLERWMLDTFLLRASPAVPDTGPDGHERLDRARLAGDESLLRAVMGLLTLAHYRTTPADLRDLLDGPNLQVWCTREAGSIVAVCLVALEGPLDDETLVREVMAGRRRPRGHLLPQMLAFHGQAPGSLALRCARVVRIAVMPGYQRQGRGAALLFQVLRELSAEGIDLAGSSFAAEPGVLEFWRCQGFVPVWEGSSRESAGGLASVLVARSLQPGVAALVDTLAAEHGSDRQALAGGAMDAGGEPSLRDARVQRFVTGALPYTSARGAIIRWLVAAGGPLSLIQRLRNEAALSRKDQQCLRAEIAEYMRVRSTS